MENWMHEEIDGERKREREKKVEKTVQGGWMYDCTACFSLPVEISWIGNQEDGTFCFIDISSCNQRTEFTKRLFIKKKLISYLEFKRILFGIQHESI